MMENTEKKYYERSYKLVSRYHSGLENRLI